MYIEGRKESCYLIQQRAFTKTTGKWSFEKTPYGGEEESGGALTPFQAPCSAQEIRRDKMSATEPQHHKACHGALSKYLGLSCETGVN